MCAFTSACLLLFFPLPSPFPLYDRPSSSVPLGVDNTSVLAALLTRYQEHQTIRNFQVHERPAQNMARKLESGQYTVTDISSGMALDLRPDNQALIAYPFHGEDNQQVSTECITLLTLGE